MNKSFGLITYCTLLYIAIGAYWITLSWTILGINPNQDAVGRLLIIGSLCTLLTAPIIGLIVDQVGFRKITVLGQSFSLVGGLIPSLVFMFGYKLTSLWIYVIALMVSISSIFCIASFDRAIKFTVPLSKLKKTRTVLSIFQQSAMMIGTGMSGYLIAKYSEFLVFPLISILAVISSSVFLIAMKGVEYSELRTDDVKKSHLMSFMQGIQHITHNKALLISALCIAAVYITAQVINVSLPAFIKLELGDGSNLFGLCEALWALGGITAAMMLTALINHYHLNWLPLASLTCLGFLMIGFAQLNNPSLILLACLIMGALFSISRTLADANVLSLCSHEMIGRVRSNIMAITSSIGIIIYTIPILAKKMLPSTLYFLVGTLTIIISLFLINLYRKNRSSYTVTEPISPIKNSVNHSRSS
jgi:DHA3 family macrolide efflux protein-like MFS transporter